MSKLGGIVFYQFLKNFWFWKKILHIYSIKNNIKFDFDSDSLALVQEVIIVLEPVEMKIKEISKSNANLMVADMAMSTCLSYLGTSKLAGKNALISHTTV